MESGFVALDTDGNPSGELGLPPGVARADAAVAMVDGSGALWIMNAGTPKRVWRLPPDGPWAEVDVGAPSHLWLCRSEGPFAVVRDFTEALRWDGASFASVGTVTDISDCFSTSTGTMLVLEGYGPYVEARFPVDGTVERTPVSAPVSVPPVSVPEQAVSNSATKILRVRMVTPEGAPTRLP
jgi:hypothetical protein